MAASPAIASHFVKPQEWAVANGFGTRLVYQFLHRADDPIPHVRKGIDYLIDDELAVAWVRRNFGVNTQGG